MNASTFSAAAYLILAAGCAATQPLPKAPLSPVAESAATSAVRSQLRDPKSAEFSGLEAGADGTETIVCGWVNAKNGFGGYTGQQPFRVLIRANGAAEVLAIGVTANEINHRDHVIRKCRGYGLLLAAG